MAMVERARRFFATNKKGENFELRAELNHEERQKRKDAVKKVIANMTIGKDVSSLFADVVKNMQTEDLELKKLVYLYLMNYAKTQPELVILAINTFLKDSDDPNPLIRALAIRTMGCLRVEKILDYILEPLKKTLRDDNPYVRKTAAICIAKLFDLSPTVCVENGLVNILQDMLSDPNPMVVANAVAALLDIGETAHRKDVFVINNVILNKLLAALNECTEWGQICILGSLADYKPVDVREAETIAEKVIPRLQHANASVVLSAVKVLMVYLKYIQNKDLDVAIIKKMAPPLVTLLSSAPEIQFVALRNINLILQMRSDVLSQEMRVFFCKYNDPPYVKLEKLEVMLKLVNDKTVDQLLSELKEYSSEVDVDFVRKSVRAIGRCAIKIESSAERCVNVLLDLIKTKIDYVVQESICVIKDIFRKYPQRYEGIIPLLCENLEALDEPEAKASLIWIIGEYAERIDNAINLLEHFAEGFVDEDVQVQLQLVTASVKLLLKRPGNSQALVQRILQSGTQECDNPDLRDRAYVYWRLLSSNPQAAKTVVLTEMPPIQHEDAAVSESLLDELIQNIATLASVYHMSPKLIGSEARFELPIKLTKDDEEERDGNEDAPVPVMGIKEDNLLDLDFDPGATSPSLSSAPAAPPKTVDLLGDFLSTSAPMAMHSSSRENVAGVTVFPKTQLLSPAAGKGLEILGTFSRVKGTPSLDLTLRNHSELTLSDFAIQFNKNVFGIIPAAPLVVPSPLAPLASTDVSVPLSTSGPRQQMQPANLLQIAVKTNVDVLYFQALIPIHIFVSPSGPSDVLSSAASTTFSVQLPFQLTEMTIKSKFEANCFSWSNISSPIATAVAPDGTVFGAEFLIQGNVVNVTATSTNPDLGPAFQNSVNALLADVRMGNVV